MPPRPCTSAKQTASSPKAQPSDAVLVAYVEAKPRGFGFDDEEDDVPFVVDIAGQLGQKRVEHGDEESA